MGGILGRCTKVERSATPPPFVFGDNSRSDVEEMRMHFNTYDRNGDGLLTTEEMLESLQQLSFRHEPATLQRICEEVNNDRSPDEPEIEPPPDGLVDWPLYLHILSHHRKSVDQEEALREAFMVFEQERRGTLSPHGVRSAMRALGRGPRSDREMREMMETVKVDGDITLDNFKLLLQVDSRSGSSRGSSRCGSGDLLKRAAAFQPDDEFDEGAGGSMERRKSSA